MSDPSSGQRQGDSVFRSAEWYDQSINWEARLGRELPVLMDVFGPPGKGGLIDAGCGTGHQARALAQKGYRVVGADASEEMLDLARRRATAEGLAVDFIEAPYEVMPDKLGGGFDGIYCLGNALAAAGSRDGVAVAIEQFGKCLRPGGRLFVQVLNFPLMREDDPCVRGPRISTVDGQAYISVRQFHFHDERVRVTNITLWHDNGWHQRAHGGWLYPVTLSELTEMCTAAGLAVDKSFGSYARERFDPARSTDLIVTATSNG